MKLPTRTHPLFIQYKPYLKFLIKLLLSLAGLVFVFNKIEAGEVAAIISKAQYIWFLPAIALFIFSKWASAYRLNIFYHQIGLHLSTLYYIKLYWIGMFYNLFLPGAIGGDGYKVYLLRNRHEKNYKELITATLLDRISGLIALGMLLCISLWWVLGEDMVLWKHGALITAVLIYPLAFLVCKWFFKKFVHVFHHIQFWSFMVQLGQILTIVMFLFAFGGGAKFLEYTSLFLISTVVSMLPISIGGVGARESAFVVFPAILNLPVDKTLGVLLSLLFFLITALTSLIGAFLELKPEERDK